MEEVQKHRSLERLLIFRPNYYRALTVEKMLKVARHYPALVKAHQALSHGTSAIDNLNDFYKLMPEIDPGEADTILHLHIGYLGMSDYLQKSLDWKTGQSYKELRQYLQTVDGRSPTKCLGEFYAKMNELCEGAKRQY
ncbi:MAG: hypothetical protein LBF42_01005 [Puniceicoccales bacterium]|jgi:hypothetical protein|nr:hypothetical protein [Puniceicoccales bacterium]